MRAMTMSALTVLCACGGMAAPDVGAWNGEIAQARQRVTAYQDLVATVPAPADCAVERDRYVAELRPSLTGMRDMSRGFDDCFRSMGHMGYANVEGMCSDMDFELDRYATAGCASSDPAINRSSALEHCRRMLDFLDNAASRATSMGNMMSAGACR